MESNLPLVSVIIPTYNRATLVTQAINSVLGQTYKNIEIIVVDDGSKDNTEETLATYGNRIRYLYKENGGCASARNLGMQEVKGEYIALLDSDDIWYNDKIEKQVKKLKNNPGYDIVLTEMDKVDKNNLPLILPKLRKTIVRDGDIFKYVLRNPHVGLGSCMLAHIRIFREVGLFDVNLQTAEDKDWLFRACSKFKVTLIDEPLAKIVVSPDSISLNLFTKNSLRALEKLKTLAPEAVEKHYKLFKKAVSLTHLRYAKDLLWYRKIKEGRGQILESLKNHFSLEAILLYLKSWFIGFFIRKS